MTRIQKHVPSPSQATPSSRTTVAAPRKEESFAKCSPFPTAALNVRHRSRHTHVKAMFRPCASDNALQRHINYLISFHRHSRQWITKTHFPLSYPKLRPMELNCIRYANNECLTHNFLRTPKEPNQI